MAEEEKSTGGRRRQPQQRSNALFTNVTVDLLRAAEEYNAEVNEEARRREIAEIRRRRLEAQARAIEAEGEELFRAEEEPDARRTRRRRRPRGREEQIPTFTQQDLAEALAGPEPNIPVFTAEMFAQALAGPREVEEQKVDVGRRGFTQEDLAEALEGGRIIDRPFFTQESLDEALEGGRIIDREDQFRTDNRYYNQLMDDAHENGLRVYLENFAKHYAEGPGAAAILARFLRWRTDMNLSEDDFEVKAMDVLNFFVTINDGLDVMTFTQNRHRSSLRTTLKQWVSELEQYVRSSVARGVFDVSYRRRFVQAPSFLVNRLTVQEVNWAIEYTITVVQRTLRTEEQKEAASQLISEVCQVPYFRPPVLPRDIDENHPSYNLAYRLSRMTQDRLDNIWKVFLSVVHVMNRVVSSRLSVTDVLLSQQNYRRTSEFNQNFFNVGELRATQAFPFILFDAYHEDINLVDDLMIPDLYKKYLQTKPFREQHIVDDIWVKVKVKIIFTQNTPEGQQNETRYWVMNLNLINVLAPRDYERDPFTDEIPEGVIQATDDEKEELWAMLEDEESFKEAFMQLLTNQLKEAPEHYKEKYEFLDEEKTQIDLKSIGIGYTQLGVRLKRALNGERFVLDPNSTILKPAFCQTASEGLIKKCAAYSEVTNYGICLYEALWTAKYYEEIASRRAVDTRDGLKKMYVKEDRKWLILDSFTKEPFELQECVFKGDTVAFTLFARTRGYQVYFWDGAPENLPAEYLITSDELTIMRPTIMIFAKHAICATTAKVKNEVKKRCLKASAERTTSFVCRPLDRLKEEPLEENWCLDIECSIDKKTGIFEPYFIGVILHNKTLRPQKWNAVKKDFEEDTDSPTRYGWWGPNCKADLIAWMKTKVAVDLGCIGKQKKPNKISLWGYNILKFDCIFFLIDMLKEFVDHGEVDVKGSVENPKSVIVNSRLTIRDLLKIVPGMSLDKAGAFWNTTKRKTHVNHDEITNELIARIYELEAEEHDMIIDTEVLEEREKLFKLKADLIEYCMNDIEVTIECIEKYMQWVWSNFTVSPYVISTASLSLSIWLTHYHPGINHQDRQKDFNYKNPVGMSRDNYDKVRTSYKGGLVLVPRQINDERAVLLEVEKVIDARPVFVFDINSHYPACMMKKIPYKFIKSRTFGHGWKDLTNILSTEIVSTNLYGVKSLKWKEGTFMPTIPKRTTHGLNNTLTHDYLDYIWGVELKHAVDTGHIKEGYIYEEMVFEADFVYREFVESLHGMRLKFQAKGDKAGEKFVKLILNSLYGKMAQKNYPNTKIVNNNGLRYYADQIIEPPVEICPGIWSITIDQLAECAAWHISHQPGEIHPAIAERKHIGTLVHMAAYITATARVVLLKFCNDVGWENVLYTDTDSATIFLCLRKQNDRNPYKSLPKYSEEEQRNIDYLRETYLDDSKLGYFKEEKNENDTILFRFIAVAKKMYLLQGIDKDGKIVSYIKSKGLTTGNMSLEDFLELKATGKLLNKKGGQKWNRHKGFVQIKDNIKSLNVTNFRTYINNGLDSIPFNS